MVPGSLNPLSLLTCMDCFVSRIELLMLINTSFFRKLKKPGVHATIIKLAPHTCNVYVVSQSKVVSKLATNIENAGC